MKAILGLIVVLAAGGIILYYTAGYSSFDPSKQGRDHRAAITPGATWKQVVDINPPKKWRAMIKTKKKVGKEEIETIEPGPQNPFDGDRVAARLADGSLPHGFRFDYVYSGSVAFAVVFDEVGLVTEVQDLVTMGDLLQIEKD